MADLVDIAYGLALLRERQERDRLMRAYYDGQHRLAFSTQSFRSAFGYLFRSFAYNRCRSVIDAIADRLLVTGWDVAGGGGERVTVHADEIWRRNRMRNRQNETIKEALRSGDAYLIVWPDAESGLARFHPNPAHLVTVVYDEEDQGRALLAVKAWRLRRGDLRGRWRVTVYERDRITRWITASATAEYPTNPSRLVPFEDDAPPETANPLGEVPVVHFANDADTGSFGHSELADIVPLQDALNKAIADMLVVGEFAAFPQRWATGIEHEPELEIEDVTGTQRTPFQSGIDRVWVVADHQAKFGQFDPTNLTQFVTAQDAWDAKIARVSSVPVHWLNQTNPTVSGISLRLAEAPFVSKILDRQAAFSDAWAGAMRLALRIEGEAIEMVDRIEPVWISAESRPEREVWEVAQLKLAAGVPPQKVWAEAGYSEAEIAEMEAMQAARQEREAAELTGFALDEGA